MPIYRSNNAKSSVSGRKKGCLLSQNKHTLTGSLGGHRLDSISVASLDALAAVSWFLGTNSRIFSSTSSKETEVSKLGISSRHAARSWKARDATFERLTEADISAICSADLPSCAKDWSSFYDVTNLQSVTVVFFSFFSFLLVHSDRYIPIGYPFDRCNWVRSRKVKCSRSSRINQDNRSPANCLQRRPITHPTHVNSQDKEVRHEFDWVLTSSSERTLSIILVFVIRCGTIFKTPCTNSWVFIRFSNGKLPAKAIALFLEGTWAAGENSLNVTLAERSRSRSRNSWYWSWTLLLSLISLISKIGRVIG